MFGVLVYVGISLWVGLDDFQDALADLPLVLLPIACGLSFTNYLIRFIKWERYRKLLGIELARGTSFLVYMAGFSMGITPGKMGELIKSWLIKQINGVRIHQSAPIVVAERVTDLLGYLILVAVGGLASHPQYQGVFWLVLGLCGLGIALAGSHRFSTFVHAVVSRTPVVSRLAPKVKGSFESTRILLSPREIVLPTLLSAVSWGCECVGFWLIADALVDADVSFLFAVFAYSFSAVAGAVLILFPGGIGPTEGLLGSLLRRQYQQGMDPATLGLAHLSGAALDEALRSATRPAAGAAVLLTRLCTLWFGVAVGMVALAIFRKRFGALREESLEEEEALVPAE